MKNGLSILGLLIILVVGYVALNAMEQAKLPVQAQAQGQNVAQAQDFSVMGPPSVSAQFIDKVLCEAQSPACHTGQALYEMGKQYRVDPVFALAFFQHESSFGKYGVARETLGLGNIRCSAGYTCKQGFRAYRSWSEGYRDWYVLIAWYVGTLHKSTVAQIIPTYAPDVENDTPGYIRAICQAVSTWRSEM